MTWPTDPNSPDSKPIDSNPSAEASADDKAVTTRCPICQGPVLPGSRTYPFCSPRCRTIDLGKWIKGDYIISRPVEEQDLEQDD